MDRTISATVQASAAATMAALADLASYPRWLSLVSAAVPDDHDDIWLVTLRARLGPLARSKRLRMRRVELDDRHVRFERAEIDGRTHADWILEAEVESQGPTRTAARVHLHYGGALWSAPLEIALVSFEGSAADRLSNYLSNG